MERVLIGSQDVAPQSTSIDITSMLGLMVDFMIIIMFMGIMTKMMNESSITEAFTQTGKSVGKTAYSTAKQFGSTAKKTFWG